MKTDNIKTIAVIQHKNATSSWYYIESQDSFIVQGEGLNYAVNKGFVHSKGHNKGTLHDIGLSNHKYTELMINPFGNYLVQKLLEICNDEHKMYKFSTTNPLLCKNSVHPWIIQFSMTSRKQSAVCYTKVHRNVNMEKLQSGYLFPEAVEILARSLETESSMHRRVDLFFLVDSITQCSRGMKGQVGGVYPSAIQAALPRLLSAAAPPGSYALENRRQCSKVLRLWLERKIFPESIVRHHMRELDSFGGSASAGPYSRRSARTERALD